MSRNWLLRSTGGAALCVAMATYGFMSPALAQSSDDEEEPDIVVITGTRIQNPDVVAASPITAIGLDEIDRKFTPNVERVFRDLPITIPGDGQNVNNGTAGRAEIDLRALGPERSLVLINGKRLSPHDIDGVSDINTIPINMVERIDIITGGASAVYGSDAMSGATNFILRNDFEGLELDAGYSVTGPGGGDTYDFGALFGAGLNNGRGHVVVGMTFTERDAVLFGERDFGVVGVDSETGDGITGEATPPPADCTGNIDLTTANVGSTTSIPGTLNLRSGRTFQFRDDMSLVEGACARFNFNPFNLYQTPQSRWQSTAIANYEINDWIEMYGRASFSSSDVSFQIAPSGTFGETFTIPVMNPFFNDAARQLIVDDLNLGAQEFIDANNDIINDPDSDADTVAAATAALAADPLGFGAVGIIDFNGDGVFDANDAFLSTARRRTVELGPRSAIFNTDYFQFVGGLRGTLPSLLTGWNYDLSWQFGQSDFVETRDGFTNLTNLQAGINTVDPDQCIDLAGNVTAAPCTPINVFGPLGSITDEQRDSGFFVAVASDLRQAEQIVAHGSLSGPVTGLASPLAETPVQAAFGWEYRKETASSNPDDCLRLAPSSCQGGAGGNRLPIFGEYRAWEGFAEAIVPLVENRPLFHNLSLEGGYRYSDFRPQGQTDSWKAGLSWETTPGLRFRFMEQQAVRVPNIGELFAPVTTGLDNATADPCSEGNPNPPQPGSQLFDLCVQTGVLPFQVGTVPDIIAGQVNVFNGTNPNSLPDPETARTRTAGVIWQFNPADTVGGDFLETTVSFDYYDIEIEDYIDEPTGQEALDLCYVLADPVACAGIVRIGGALTVSGTGAPAFFTNFTMFRAEGLQFGMQSGYDLGQLGDLSLAFNGNYYLTNEFQTTATSAVVDCNGRYGTSCDPVPQWRHTVRGAWAMGAFDASLLWRRIGSMELQENEKFDAVGDPLVFVPFQQIDAFDYFDLSGGFQANDSVYISGIISNLANKEPPIIGNDTGSTTFNSGNTFPSLYDTLGRTYGVNVKVNF